MGLTELKNRGADLDRLKTDRQRRFVLLYAVMKVDGSGGPKDAAIAAGYNVKYAAQSAQKLLRNPIVKAYLGKLERQDVEQLELDRHEVLRQLWYMLTRRASDFVAEDGSVKSVHEMSDRAQSVIDGLEVEERFTEDGERIVKTKLKLSPKATAVDMAMKHKGLFAPDKLDIRGGLFADWDKLVGDGRAMVPDRIEEAIETKFIEHEEK